MLQGYLRRTVVVGDLSVDEGDGRVVRYGDGSGPPVALRFTSGSAVKLLLGPELKLGELYMDGALTFQAGDLMDLMELVARNPAFWDGKRGPVLRMADLLASRLRQINDRRAARRNVAHHYDLSHALYSRFLDPDMQYSCAYFVGPDETLEAAQVAKKAHILAKLDLPQTGRVLDIGCGWGGLGLAIARARPGLQVLGLTLSVEQLAVAQRRAREEGLQDRVHFELKDYRDAQGPFDRIVSVGMFEHVGQPNYQQYFDTVARLLAEDGVALIHSIGRRTAPGVTHPFVAKYIFPGGYIPSLSEVMPPVERAGLWTTDIEVLRLHYALTLKAWRERFMAAREEMAALYDERFCRMWEAYLAFSEAGFRWFGMMNFQIQLTRRIDALPINRGYMSEAEAGLLDASAGPTTERRAAAE